LPVPHGGEELSYRLNSPLRSVVLGGERLNRLAHWSTRAQQILNLVIQGETTQQHVVEEQHEYVLTLDLNTDAKFVGAYVPNTIRPVLEELAQAVTSILHEGYDALS